MHNIQLYTIGFTKKSAEDFFTKLSRAGVKQLIDVRLNNVSQLAGFAKKEDLRYFLKSICNIDYIHITDLAPTQDMLDEFKKNKGEWSIYERKFLQLMRSRKIEETLKKSLFDGGCLLCSEEKPHHCHRRLVAEYLQQQWGNLQIDHIV